MDDHPDIRNLPGHVPVEFHQVNTARDGLFNTVCTAINFLVFITLMIAIPVVVALWRWAL